MGAGTMRKPTILVGLGSGQEAWLSIELGSLQFELETGNGQRTVEKLSLYELKTRLPNVSGLVAEILAEAVRSQAAGTH